MILIKVLVTILLVSTCLDSIQALCPKRLRSFIYDTRNVNNGNVNSFILTPVGANIQYNRNIVVYNGYNYVADLLGQKVFIFNSNWQFVAQKPVNQIIYFLTEGANKFYLSLPSGIVRYNSDLNVLEKSFNAATADSYRVMYYEESTNELYAPNLMNNRIDIFNSDLSSFRSIPVSPAAGRLVAINKYDGLYYLATESGIVVVTNGISVLGSFQTNCLGTVHQLSFDDYGVMSVPCSTATDKNLYFYYPNGTYTGVLRSGFTSQLMDLEYDANYYDLVLISVDDIFKF